MSRKHFIAIARILKDTKADPLIIREFASLCASENMYFDYDKFYEASGLDSHVD
jgi:hypothetical protein